MKKMLRRIGNTGSSLVMTLIVAAFIGILGTTILSMTVSAYRMRAMSAKSQDTFYSADMAVEEIYNRLGIVAYDALKAAYETVLENLVDEEDMSAGLITNDEANQRLKDTYFLNLFEAFSVTNGESRLNTPAQQSILLGTEETNALLEGYLANANMTQVHIIGGSTEQIMTDGRISSITFKDITVEYADAADDYYSRITVDFEVKFPEISELAIVDDGIDGLMTFKTYAFVTDGSLTVNVDAAVAGGVYAYQNMTINRNANIQDGNLVTTGDVKVTGGAALNFDNGNIWADNILLENGSITLQGGAAAYVKDDLTLSAGDDGRAVNSAVINGSYYGYSHDGNDSENGNRKSSAIIINSEKTVLNLKGIKELVLGGFGWIIFDNGQEDYRTGESIAIKGNQVAYALPAEWNGNVPTSFYGYGLLNASQNTIERNGTYYFNFSSSKNTTDFFRSLFHDETFEDLCGDLSEADRRDAVRDRNRIKASVLSNYGTYLDLEKDEAGITINGDARVYAPGITFAAELINTTTGNDFYRYNDIDIVKMSNDYGNRYDVIASLLLELPGDWDYTQGYIGKRFSYDFMNYSHTIIESELEKGAFENIIKNTLPGSAEYYYSDVDRDGNPDGDYFVYVSSNSVNLAEICNITGRNKGIIISGGTVTASCDFTGTILAEDEININGGVYRADGDLMEEIFLALPGITGYFTGADVYGGHSVWGIPASTEETSVAEETGDLNRISGNNCVDMHNYRRGGVEHEGE